MKSVEDSDVGCRRCHRLKTVTSVEDQAMMSVGDYGSPDDHMTMAIAEHDAIG